MSAAARTFKTPQHDFCDSDDTIDLGEYVATLFQSRKLITFATLFSLLCASIYLWMVAPSYQADAVIQVEAKAAPTSDIGALSSLLVGDTQTPAEIEILTTRRVLSTVVEQLDLDIIATPGYFPLVGASIARRSQNAEPDDLSNTPTAARLISWLGADYAWSNEYIEVSRLSLPDELIGRPLSLLVGSNGSYDLFDEEGQHILSGRVGTTSVTKTGPFAGTELYVRELRAASGIRFKLLKVHKIVAIKKLHRDLTVSERGRQTGILVITLEGPDPSLVTKTVNAVADTYVRQHVERRSEEASKMLEFLESQLPELKDRADTTEQLLQKHRAETGSIDLTLEAQQILNKAADVEKKIAELKLQEPELERKFTFNHPARKAFEQQLTQLHNLRDTLEKELKALPGTEWETLRLARDAKVASELYVMLLNQAQELRVAKAGTLGNVRILDRAYVPIDPVKPRKGLTLIIALLLGLFTGTMIAFVRRALTHATDDPDQLERQLGLPVYASIPHSRIASHQGKLRRHGQPPQLLSMVDKRDYALESLRSLRTSLQFITMNAPNKVVCISGPSPHIGKSFVCANLAVVMAEGGKRLLLIDADMRKGHLHDYFAIDGTQGLSQVLSDAMNIDAAIRKTTIETLDLLPNGTPALNPAELLLSDRFAKLIAYASTHYETVLIDTPPILAVTDPAIVAKHAGTNLVVLRAGMHPVKEIEQALKRIRQIGVMPNGFIFNDVSVRTNARGYHTLSQKTYSYQYDYR
ncbi:MAG: polysaccharide biosynthesis tyrosine autokinase [Gammaproteobacteria bacterium]